MSNQNKRMAGDLDTIAEAQSLLAGVGFSESQGAYLQGKRVVVVLDPRVNEDHRTFQVLVTCYPIGHLKPDWAWVTIEARRESKEKAGPSFFAFLDTRGQALFPRLSLGRYSITLMEHCEEVSQQLERNAANRDLPMEECKDAVAKLKTIATHPGSPAESALLSCLNLLCDSSIPVEIRVLASQAFTGGFVDVLHDVNLAPYAEKVMQPQDVRNPANLEGGLEPAYYQGFGAILSRRSLTRDDDKLLLIALIQRNMEYETVRRAGRPVLTTGAMRIRGGPVRTRGAVRAPEILSPLVVLARSGGRGVRDALIKLLGSEPGNDDLIAELGRITF